MLYIPNWERDALSRDCLYRLPAAVPEVQPQVPRLKLPPPDAGLTKQEPDGSLTAAGSTAAASSGSAAGGRSTGSRTPWANACFQKKVSQRWAPKGSQAPPVQKIIKRKEEPSQKPETASDPTPPWRDGSNPWYNKVKPGRQPPRLSTTLRISRAATLWLKPWLAPCSHVSWDNMPLTLMGSPTRRIF